MPAQPAPEPSDELAARVNAVFHRHASQIFTEKPSFLENKI